VIVYQIKLPKKQDAEAFVKFMREEYFPAVYKGPTRVGQVEDLVLLQEEPESRTTDCEFFLHVGWNGFPNGHISVDDDAITRKFDAFEASLERLGSYEEVAVWHQSKAA
jgi:hypothetical protein